MSESKKSKDLKKSKKISVLDINKLEDIYKEGVIKKSKEEDVYILNKYKRVIKDFNSKVDFDNLLENIYNCASNGENIYMVYEHYNFIGTNRTSEKNTEIDFMFDNTDRESNDLYKWNGKDEKTVSTVFMKILAKYVGEAILPTIEANNGVGEEQNYIRIYYKWNIETDPNNINYLRNKVKTVENEKNDLMVKVRQLMKQVNTLTEHNNSLEIELKVMSMTKKQQNNSNIESDNESEVFEKSKQSKQNKKTKKSKKLKKVIESDIESDSESD